MGPNELQALEREHRRLVQERELQLAERRRLVQEREQLMERRRLLQRQLEVQQEEILRLRAAQAVERERVTQLDRGKEEDGFLETRSLLGHGKGGSGAQEGRVAPGASSPALGSVVIAGGGVIATLPCQSHASRVVAAGLTESAGIGPALRHEADGGPTMIERHGSSQSTAADACTGTEGDASGSGSLPVAGNVPPKFSPKKRRKVEAAALAQSWPADEATAGPSGSSEGAAADPDSGHQQRPRRRFFFFKRRAKE